MSQWTADRVLQLAPDPASAKAGQGLTSPGKWPSLGHDDGAVWGECQGSGSKPYQVQVDLSEPAFKCSCPSRKFPCKHGIGLMLMFAAGKLSPGAQPAWVVQWLSTRAEKQQKKTEKAEAPTKPVDEVAQAKRREKRLDRIGDGLASLKLWAEDQIKAGLAIVPSRGYGFFDQQAQRLIDAQCPGVARSVQGLAGIATGNTDWHRTFFEELSLIHMTAVAFGGRDQLPPETRDDLDAVLGLPLTQDEILARPAVADRWQIVASETLLEDKLRVRKTWLFGVQTRRPAIVFAFAHGTTALDSTLPAGFAFDGELCFHPGRTIRAVVKTRKDLAPIGQLDGVPTLEVLLDELSKLRAGRPWFDEIALPVLDVIPMKTDTSWQLVDRDRRSLPMVVTDAVGWRLAAVSGGNPVDVVVAVRGSVVRPLGVAVGSESVALAATEVTA